MSKCNTFGAYSVVISKSCELKYVIRVVNIVVNIMEEKDFGLRLAKFRTRKNVSAREMSLAIGQNSNYINHIERGQGMPSLTGLFYICEYLGITPGEFFDTETEDPVKLKEINQYLRRLDDEQLEIVEKLVKNLAKDKR